MKKSNKHKCCKCEYEWESKLEAPKSCPRCKRYDWKQMVSLTERGGGAGETDYEEDD